MAGAVDGLFDLPCAEQLDKMLQEGVSPRDVARYVQEDIGVYTDVSTAALVAVIRGRKESLSLVRDDDDMHMLNPTPGVRVRGMKAVYVSARDMGMRAKGADAEAIMMHAALASIVDHIQVGIDSVNASGRFNKDVHDAMHDYLMALTRVYEVQRKYHVDEKKADAEAALARANEAIANATASLPASLSKVMANPESRQKLLAFAARMRAVHRVIDVDEVKPTGEAEGEPQALAEGGTNAGP